MVVFKQVCYLIAFNFAPESLETLRNDWNTNLLQYATADSLLENLMEILW
jgi:hypothetical protein